jgi:hypothetical protein
LMFSCTANLKADLTVTPRYTHRPTARRSMRRCCLVMAYVGV